MCKVWFEWIYKGRPLIEYAERLLKFPEDINFFFHAGETNWLGTTSDENLVWIVVTYTKYHLNCFRFQVDAILLGTKRIGHGFSAIKYPNILKIVKERRIGIEVNPISNQVLKLVDDFRNHPCAVFFSDDYPVVISRFVTHFIFNEILFWKHIFQWWSIVLGRFATVSDLHLFPFLVYRLLFNINN